MRRKVLSVVLCVCMMMTMAPFAFAEENSGTGNSDATTPSKTFDLTQAIQGASKGDTIALNTGVTAYLKNDTANTGNAAREVTIKGDKTQTVDIITYAVNAENGMLSYQRGSKFTFEDVTIQAGEGSFDGIVCDSLTFKNCTIKGKLTLYGAATFENCTFENTMENQYSIWTWGGTTVNVTNCTFNTNGKAILLYGRSTAANPTNLTVTGCTFNDRKNGAAEKAAVEIGNEYNATYNLTITNATVNGFAEGKNTGSKLWANKNSMKASNLTVTIDGQNVPTIIAASIGSAIYESLEAAIDAANTGDTVTLLRNVTYDITLELNKSITLDLGDNTIERSGSGNDARAIYINDGANVTIKANKNGGVKAATIALQVKAGGKLTVQGGTYEGAYALTLFSSATKKAEAVLEDGVFNGWIYTNGTGHDDHITFNGGTYNKIMYLASGDKSTYTINDGLFKEGLEIDAGTLDILGGTFKASVDTTNNVNSPETNNNGSGAYTGIIVVCKPTGSSTKGYIGNAVVNIKGGTFENTFENGETIVVADFGKNENSAGDAKVTISENAKVTGKVVLYTTEDDTDAQLAITGGYFTTDPSAYLSDEKAAVESDLAGYNYMVADKKSTPATVAAATPAVDTAGLSGGEKTAATEIANKLDSDTVAGDGLTAAANTVANNNTVTGEDGKEALQNVVSNTENTRIVVQTYMDIDITGISTGDTKTLTLDITPMYRTVATTAATDSQITLAGEGVTGANAVPVGPAGKLTINKPVTVKIPLPTNFASNGSTVYVQHKGHEYTATVSQDASNNLIATFTNPDGFSPFTISTESTAVAKIGENRYTSFQAAVDAAQNNDVITLVNNDAVSATMSGASRTITVKAPAGTTGTVKVTVNGETKAADTDTGATFTYTRPSHSSSGSTTTSYNVNVTAATNGTVTADKKTAAKGATVTVTVTPSSGYVVEAVKVVDKDGKDVAVTAKDGKYVFTMPGSAVTVTGSFKAETPAESGLPFVDVKNGDWFYDAVKYAYENGLMTGTSATTFAPNGTMNRAMIVTVLYRLEKSPAVTAAAKFTDVPAGQWYSDAVAWAAANGIVNGYDETTFGPMNAVTREQLAAILFRYEQVKGLENVTLEENLNRFPDKDKISAYAVPALQWAVGQKVINGNADGTLDPTGTATRAQVAQILMNLLQ